MTLPSVFPDMKSVNPAVIGLRKSGILKLSGSQDTYKKNLIMKEINGSPYEAEQNDNVTITGANLFKGGKGGGTTTEWLLDYTMGKQETTFETPTDKSEFTIDSTSIYGKYAWGFNSRWGFEFHYLNYSTSYQYEEELSGGQKKTTDIDLNIMMPGVRIGKIVGSPALSLGFIAEVNALRNSMKSSDPTVKGNTGIKPMPILGLGLGTGGGDGLLEVGVEVNAMPQEKDESTGEKPAMPVKVSMIAERKLGPIILGYKGMYFKGQFMDFDKMIPTQMVYKNSGDEGRLEHVINFMLKPEKGLSIGASVSISNTKTQEKSSYIMSENKHDTTIKSFGIGVKIGYVW